MDAFKEFVEAVGQAEAAKRLGISQGMVSHILTGRKKVSAERAIDIEERMKRSKYKLTRADLRPDLYGVAA